MHANDEVRLRHMLDAAREAVSFWEGRKKQDLADNRLLTHALVRCIEIIGEAAAKVSATARAEHPEIPWADIAGMRNRLIHAYFAVDLARVYDTLTVDLPHLIPQLERILAEPSRSAP